MLLLQPYICTTNKSTSISSVRSSLADALRGALVDKPPTRMRPIETIADGDIKERADCMIGQCRVRIPCLEVQWEDFLSIAYRIQVGGVYKWESEGNRNRQTHDFANKTIVAS